VNPYLRKLNLTEGGPPHYPIGALPESIEGEENRERQHDESRDGNGDDDSCDSVKAFLIGQHPVQEGTPLGELAPKNCGICYYEFLQGGMVLFTAYNGNQRPAFTLHATIAAKFGMPPFDSHICSGVNYSVAPNSNIRLMEPGNKSYTGVLVNWADFNNRHEVISFFHHYIRFLNTHTYRKNDNLTLQERILHQPNLSDYRSALSPAMTNNPKRKLGDVITVSNAIDHLQKAAS
jgi:hypothetical protein